jgi:hypothetical protein
VRRRKVEFDIFRALLKRAATLNCENLMTLARCMLLMLSEVVFSLFSLGD